VVSPWCGWRWCAKAAQASHWAEQRSTQQAQASLEQRAAEVARESVAGLSCSIGVSAQLPTAASQPENLLKCADTALYAAKQNGRAWVMCFDVKAGGAM